jgi:hypothetical protein
MKIKIARLLFVAAIAGCFPGGALSQAAANFSDSSSSADLSYSPYASSAANFSAFAIYNSASASSGTGTELRSSGSKQQVARSRGYSPSTESVLERKLAEGHGNQPSAAQIRAASPFPSSTNPFPARKVGVSRAIQPTSLGASSLPKRRGSAVSSSPSQPSTSTSNPDMSLLKRVRGRSGLSGSSRSLRSQKSTSRLSTRSQELKSLLGMSGQP